MPNMLPCSGESPRFNYLPQEEAWGEMVGQQQWPPYVKHLPWARACHMFLMRKLRLREVGDLSEGSLVMKQWHGSHSKARHPNHCTQPAQSVLWGISGRWQCGGNRTQESKDARNDTGPKKERKIRRKKKTSGIHEAAKMVNNHHKRKWGDAVYK